MNAAYAHLLINHVPVYAELLGAVALAYGLARRVERGTELGLYALVLAALTSIPAFVSGKKAAPLVAAMQGVERANLRLHHHASLDALYAALAVGAAALLVLVGRRRAMRWTGRGLVLTLVGSLVASALVARAAHLGGRIRHSEIGFEAESTGFEHERERRSDMSATKEHPSLSRADTAAAFPKKRPAPADPVLPGQVEGDLTVADFHFATGERLSEVRLHYTTLGVAHRDGSGRVDNAILLLHGTMGRGKAFLADAFRGAMFGPGQPFDTSRYFVVLPDAIGHGSSSKPSDGLRARFPHYGYTDMVELQHRLMVDGLGVTHTRVVAGTSMGGMHTWIWCTRYPNEMDGAVPIAANPSPIRGRNLLWRRVIIEATTSDPAYNGGDYAKPPYGYVATLPLFHMMLDSTAHLQSALPDVSRAADFVHGDFGPSHPPVDANDAIYALDASRDYDPGADLAKIRAKVLAIQFADDEIIVPSLAESDGLFGRVAKAERVLVPASGGTRGHSTLGLADQWQGHVAAFLGSL